MSEPDAQVTVEISTAGARLGARARDALVNAVVQSTNEGFPAGFNLAVVDRSDFLFRAWGGYANLLDGPVETSSDTLYDLASLTKVVVTTTLALWLVDKKMWKLEQPVARWLGDFERTDITLKQLITHTSGMIPHRPFFHLGAKPGAVRRAVIAEAQLAKRPGRVNYSDLNFMLLGWAIEECAGEPLDRLFQRVVAGPLMMKDTGYNPRGARARRAAATELDGDQRLVPMLVQGSVHDGNAWSLGGVSGHAGLFSTVTDLSAFVQSFLGTRRHHLMSRGLMTRMTTPQAGKQPDIRGLGWRLAPRGCGHWDPDTFWHTGFTGTSLMVSPETNIAVVLLCNAVHPTRDLKRQEAFRVAVLRAVARASS